MQQHGSKYFSLHPHPPDPAGGIKRSKFNFFRTCHVAYQIKWNHECSNMVANILSADPYSLLPQPPRPSGGVNRSKFSFFQNMVIPMTLGWVKRSKFNFLEHGYVAYQIKWNHHECSNMATNIWFADPYHHSRPLGWGQWVEIQLFQNMIIKCSNMVANILPPPNRSKFNIFRIWSYRIKLNAATWSQIFCPFS